jgi:hypothetical protein
MTLRDSSGTALNKTEFTAKTTAVPTVPVDRVLTENIYETYSLSGEGDRHESGRRLKYRKGTRLPQAVIDGLFVTATVTSITPATGPAAGGTVVTAKGTHLSGLKGVTVGGVAATAVTVVDSTTVKFTTPAGTAGARDVVFNDDGGTVTKTGFYTYS